MKIRVVTPIISREFGEAAIADLVSAARTGTEVSNVFLDRGPASVESPLDEALAVPETVARVMAAEAEGFDAVMINCMGDPGLEAARTVVGIPVVGACQAGMYLAASLGSRIAILSIGEGGRRSDFFERAQRYHFTGLVAVHGTGYAVLELEEDRAAMTAVLVDTALRAVREDEADVLLFGCTGMAGVARQVEAGLRRAGLEVPVVDPAVAALKAAETLVDMKLSHSRLAYPHPPQKRVEGYDYLPLRPHGQKGTEQPCASQST